MVCRYCEDDGYMVKGCHWPWFETVIVASFIVVSHYIWRNVIIMEYKSGEVRSTVNSLIVIY